MSGRFWKRIAALVLMMTMMVSCTKAQEQALNILLIGVDSADESQNGRSDAMLLVRADPAAGDLRMVSFLRDLYVPIESVGSARLNAAYFYGGEALLRKTLTRHFDVEIDRVVTVHFSMVEELVDELGGIELEITEKERKALNALLKDNGSDCPIEQSGVQLLNGTQALCYSRIRKLDSDFQRTSRQQAVIAAMLRQASCLGYWKMFELALGYLPQIETDLSLGDILTLLPLVSNLQELDFQTAHVPFDGAYTDETINGMMVLSPNLDQNRKLLSEFLNGT